ncbi:MAG: ribonuclease Z [Butyricicoccus sp.]|nr:ribonuclease Z [Butyricicoccus sp.]
MILLVCLDDRNGMQFQGRRQSQDRLVRQDMFAQAAGHRLWVDADTARQFTEPDAPICISEHAAQQAAPGDYYFAESPAFLPPLAAMEQIIVYRWNRHYPADAYFPIALEFPAWRRIGMTEFRGYSHEKITKEVYIHENNR